MTQYRVPKKTSKYYVHEEVYKTIVHFCRQYPLWVSELAVEPDASKAVDYRKERVQSSNQYDPTSEIAMRRQQIAKKKELVDTTAREIAGPLDKWIVLGVGNGLTFYQLKERGTPCGKDVYYELRQKFYHQMSKKI